ncbi:MAG: hypothetical protein ABI353_21620 [Isosphaeraceae bacterium]
MIPREPVSRWRIGRGLSITAVLAILALPVWALAQKEEQPQSLDATTSPRKADRLTEKPPLVIDDSAAEKATEGKATEEKATEEKATEEPKADRPGSREQTRRQARQGAQRKAQDRDKDQEAGEARGDDQGEQRAKARAEVEKLEAELSEAQEQLHAQARDAMERMRKEMQEGQKRVGDQMRQLHAARQRLVELGGEVARPAGRPFPGQFNPRFRFRMVPEDRDEGRPGRDQGPRERGDRSGRPGDFERAEPSRPGRGPREAGANLERRLNQLEQKFDRLMDELKDQRRDRGPREGRPDRDEN